MPESFRLTVQPGLAMWRCRAAQLSALRQPPRRAKSGSEITCVQACLGRQLADGERAGLMSVCADKSSTKNSADRCCSGFSAFAASEKEGRTCPQLRPLHLPSSSLSASRFLNLQHRILPQPQLPLSAHSPSPRSDRDPSLESPPCSSLNSKGEQHFSCRVSSAPTCADLEAESDRTRLPPACLWMGGSRPSCVRWLATMVPETG